MFSQLHQIITQDDIPLEGLLFEPKRKSRVAAVWVSGLTGRFSSNPQRIHILAKILIANRVAFAIFDHRGRDIVAPIKKHTKKKKYILGGTAFERFEHCVLDIDAVIGFLRKNGYKKIFLLGYGTGANKIAYYYWKKGGRRISGLGLLGPISDIPALKEKLGRKYRPALKKAQTMVEQGKGNALLPFSLVGGAFYSARRFLSIADADHSFFGKEQVMAQAILGWIKSNK